MRNVPKRLASRARVIEAMTYARSRARLAAPFALVALVVVFFWQMIFSGRILARGDTFLYFYPYWSAAAEALRAGRIPLWNPQIFMGVPFAANSQVGYFYPLNWPLWLLLPAPYAVSASIVLHVALAALGTFLLARRQLQLSRSAAILAAVAFSLGGYLTAQIEHVNQLQGLSWLPWLLAVAGGGGAGKGRRNGVEQILALGFILALQLTAGHTQTLFISVLALVLFRLGNVMLASGDSAPGQTPDSDVVRVLASHAAVLLAGGLVAALLGAIQLLPTLELTQYSGRQGGLPLNEAISFSWHPSLVPQSILPRYGESMFTEYVAYLPLTVMFLAFISASQWRRSRSAAVALVLALGGALLALGAYNPIYLLLAQLPGFNLFRAPARWLVLYSMGLALLAGLGLDLLRGTRGGPLLVAAKRAIPWAGGVLLGLILAGYGAPYLTKILPTGQEVSAAAPSLLQAIAWLLELALAYWLVNRLADLWQSYRQGYMALLILMALASMFFVSRSLPPNRLTTPAAYFNLRPPVARLQALEDCRLLPAHCGGPWERLLSLSDTFFDPGDMPELAQIYGGRLSDEAFLDYIVAVKQKEIMAPNLPMVFDVASVDGFDGGLLPLRNYAFLMELVLPEGASAEDGRLREYLDEIPEARWLDLFGARYVITDKVGDEWHDGVFFDTQHAPQVTRDAPVNIGSLPDYDATAVWVLGDAGGGQLRITGADGESRILELEQATESIWQAPLPEPVVIRSMTLMAEGRPWQLRGLALVDRRDNTFHSLVPGNYRLLYSGDVKIYENLDVLPRAFLVEEWRWRRDAGSSLAWMARSAFNPRHEAVLVGSGNTVTRSDEAPGEATIVSYQPDTITVQARVDAPSMLILTESNYPGWQAWVNGRRWELQTVDVLFRGVILPPGEHVVEFVFESQPFNIGRWITMGTFLAGIFVLIMRQRRARSTAAT